MSTARPLGTLTGIPCLWVSAGALGARRGVAPRGSHRDDARPFLTSGYRRSQLAVDRFASWVNPSTCRVSRVMEPNRGS